MIISDGKEFTQVVTGFNFMTPTVSGYWQSGDYQCEVSRGTGIDGNKIYGVTVVNTDKMEHEHSLSKCFDSRAHALAYVKVLGK
jgi:hypothetical protein